MGRSKSNRRTRDDNTISRASALRFDVLPYKSRVALTAIEDGRFWHPAGRERPLLSSRLVAPSRTPVSRPKTFGRPYGRSTVATRPPVARARVEPRYPTSRVAFALPREVVVCARRKSRRETLFARNRAGRRGQRRPVWNEFSRISCRR